MMAWYLESRRHSLSSRGIKSAQKIPKMPRILTTPTQQYSYKDIVKSLMAHQVNAPIQTKRERKIFNEVSEQLSKEFDNLSDFQKDLILRQTMGMTKGEVKDSLNEKVADNFEWEVWIEIIKWKYLNEQLVTDKIKVKDLKKFMEKTKKELFARDLKLAGVN